GLETLISSLAVGFTPALLYSCYAHVSIPNRVICIVLVWGGVLATVTVGLRAYPRVRAAVLAGCAVVGFVVPLIAVSYPRVTPPVRVWPLNSQLYALKVTQYRKLISPSPATGGAAVALRDHFLVANGVGDLFLVSRSPGNGRLSSRQMFPGVPLNW